MIESSNRAFLYGESIFTTMKMVDGLVLDWDYHFDRLRKGVEFLYGPFIEGDDWVLSLKNRLETRLENETGDKILRVSLYREQQERGLRPLHHMSVSELKFHLFVTHPETASTKSVSLRTTPAIPRPLWWPGFLKAGSYLETIIAQKKFLQPQDDDLLFLSRDDTVLETSIANIFMVRHNKLYTPPPGPNVLEGVMRKKILELGPAYFSECLETESTLSQALKADLIFCCNSVRGPYLVNKIDDCDIAREAEALEKFEDLKKKVMV
jgi:4-amino-4-deoxychorismate lyase